MKTVTTRGRSVDIPGCLDELTPEQYEYYCFLALALSAEVISPRYFRIRWLSWLVGMGDADFTMLKRELCTELDRQLPLLDGFFLSSEDGAERLDLSTMRNLLPHYRGFNGPGDMLSGVTFGEFVECSTVVESIEDASPEETEEAYRHIARVLYHIPDDRPVPDLLLFHAPRLFGNVWNAIQSAPLMVNGRQIDFRIIFKATGEHRADDKTGWTGLTFEIAGAGLFGNVREVKDEDMWAVLLYLYKCKFEWLEEKRRNPTKK